jgi:hypothetical protein
MTKRQSVEALDNSLRDIMDQPDLPFGGGRQWCLVEISGKSSMLFEGGQGIKLSVPHCGCRTFGNPCDTSNCCAT